MQPHFEPARNRRLALHAVGEEVFGEQPCSAEMAAHRGFDPFADDLPGKAGLGPLNGFGRFSADAQRDAQSDAQWDAQWPDHIAVEDDAPQRRHERRMMMLGFILVGSILAAAIIAFIILDPQQRIHAALAAQLFGEAV